MLEQMKLILGIDDTSQDNLLTYLLSSSEERVLSYINAGTETFVEVPEAVEYVVLEVAIARFNYRGDEGAKSTNDGNFSVTWNEDFLKSYMTVLDVYRGKSGNGGGVVQMIGW